MSSNSTLRSDYFLYFIFFFSLGRANNRLQACHFHISLISSLYTVVVPFGRTLHISLNISTEKCKSKLYLVEASKSDSQENNKYIELIYISLLTVYKCSAIEKIVLKK